MDPDNITYVTEEQFAELLRLLDEPPKDLPKLRKLLAESPRWTDEA